MSGKKLSQYDYELYLSEDGINFQTNFKVYWLILRKIDHKNIKLINLKVLTFNDLTTLKQYVHDNVYNKYNNIKYTNCINNLDFDFYID